MPESLKFSARREERNITSENPSRYLSHRTRLLASEDHGVFREENRWSFARLVKKRGSALASSLVRRTLISLPSRSTPSALVHLPRELSRQSCLDRYERFVCIVLRQRQHVSRTRYFSPSSRIVAPLTPIPYLSPPVRTHWSESFIFRSPLFSRESARLPAFPPPTAPPS